MANGVIIPNHINDTDSVNAVNFIKSGNLVMFYGQITGMATDSSISVGGVKEGMRPPTGMYAVCPLYSSTAPYTPIGTVWIYANGNIQVYKGSQTSGYFAGSYLVP
jgi:hypothetical protein